MDDPKSQTAFDPDRLQQFARGFQGALIQPGDPEYEAARGVWNGMIDRRPALIARCSTAGDVATAIRFAREYGLLLSVRGGGHNVAGHAVNDGGLVIDLSPMNDVLVDPEASIVQVGGGALLGDLDRETTKYGLAVPTGVVSETGVGGLTLGGGYSHLRNKYGLACDNLLDAEVVLANGEIVTANERDNADLFWGLRGGGGNFGVVTRFTFRAVPLGPELFLTAVFHDGSHITELLRFYREFCERAPDEVSSIAICGIFPPEDLYPAHLHGRAFVLFVALHCGTVVEGERVQDPLRTIREPLLDLSGPMPYTALQTFFDASYPAGELRYYWKSLNLIELTDEAIDCMLEHARRQPSDHSTTELWHVGGAIKRVDEDAMAFSGRHAHFVFTTEANWEDPAADAVNIEWSRATLAAMEPFSDGSRYLNFAGFHEEGEEMIKKTFAAKYERLVSLKRRYDPTNLFSLNPNIQPPP